MTALFPALRSADDCHAPLVWLRREYLPRCRGCGHRQTHPVSGAVPVQTRDLMAQRPWLAAWIAAAELASRRQARRSR